MMMMMGDDSTSRTCNYFSSSYTQMLALTVAGPKAGAILVVRVSLMCVMWVEVGVGLEDVGVAGDVEEGGEVMAGGSWR